MDLSGFTSSIADLLADGSSLKATATLRYIQAILDGEVVVPGGIAMLMKELACDGYVDPAIDDAHFLGADPFVSIEGVVEVSLPMRNWTEAEAANYLRNQSPPMEPVNPDEGIKYAAKHPAAQRAHPLVISGQKCRRGPGSSDHILVLSVSANGRRADLLVVESRFDQHHRILAKPKKVASGA